MLGDRDADRAQRVMEAMLKMDKLDIANLNRAYYGRPITEATIQNRVDKFGRLAPGSVKLRARVGTATRSSLNHHRITNRTMQELFRLNDRGDATSFCQDLLTDPN